MRRCSSAPAAELGGDEVGDAGVGEPLDLGLHLGLVADDRDVFGAGGAFAVEHGPVRRQHAVDLEDLRGTGARRVDVVGDADREARADARARAARGRPRPS